MSLVFMIFIGAGCFRISEDTGELSLIGEIHKDIIVQRLTKVEITVQITWLV